MARSLNPSPGSPRPVQRGSAQIPAGAVTSVDVTINAVDPAKAVLAMNGYWSNGAGSTPGDTSLLWEIVNATTIRFSRPSAGGGSPALNFKWELESWN